MEQTKKEDSRKKGDDKAKSETSAKKKRVIPEYSTIFHGRIAFGKVPNEEQLKELLEKGYNVFVNLLSEGESKEFNYDLSKNTAVTRINFPIDENEGPASPITELVKQCVEHLNKDKKIYFHCKNGRGRTGVIASCVIGTYLGIGADLSLGIINEGHRRGHGAYKKWFRHQIPSHRNQVEFVFHFLDGAAPSDED